MDFKCSICNKEFDQFERIPRVLQCGHSYCQKCIRTIKNQKKNIFTCPIENKAHIFRKQTQQAPKNQQILKALKQLKSQNLSRSRISLALKSIQIQNKKVDSLCPDHKKLREYRCKTDGKLICSHCALIGEHKGHQLQTLNKVKQSQLIESLKLVENEIKKLECCTKIILETPNCLTKGLQKCKKQLKIEIKQIFKYAILSIKNYHEVITRKQTGLQKEIEEIIKNCQKDLEIYDNKIQQNWKKYNCIKEQIQTLKYQVQTEKKINQLSNYQLQELYDQINELKPIILKLDDQIKAKCEEISKIYKQKLRQTEFFKIQEFFISFVNQKKQQKLPRQTHIYSKNLKQQSRYSQNLYNSKVSESKFNNSRNNSIFDQYNIISNTLVQSKQLSTNKQVKIYKPIELKNNIRDQSTDSIDDLKQHRTLPYRSSKGQNFEQYGRKAEDKKNKQIKSSFYNAHSRQKNSINNIDQLTKQKKQSSPQQKKQKRPQLKFEARQKIQKILEIIYKEQGTTLQLISLQIKDFYINPIFEFIRKHDKKYGSIKIIMNTITDDGFQLILDNLKNDDITHTLHLTSNQLTELAIDKILQFSTKNKILKKFLLMKNHISKHKIKDKLVKLSQLGIHISL